MSLCGRLTIMIIITLMAVTPAAAWNATAHEVIAEIAFRHLTAPAKKEVLQMVATLHDEYPHIHSFAQLAPWPDQLRSQRIEYFTHWHYIDTAFSTDGTPLKNITDTDNAVWALERLTPVLKNRRANPYERARALAFFVHIVGDLHQPLHTVSRISADFPEGDRGGNLFSLSEKSNESHNNLHHLWDGGLGLFEVKATQQNVRKLADTLMQTFPPQNTDRQTNAKTWAAEGIEIARSFAYNTRADQHPSENYLAKGRFLAGKRVALAGYRLAQLLNEYSNSEAQ